ncbi:MAG: hypothetical protein IK079_03985, partial [Desulfovibrio sp.]|nr:hypothetical protein [Desulfovibrio sp.]
MADILTTDAPQLTDLSRTLLTTIFGDQWWLGGEVEQGIFELLRTLNAVCAVVIAWLMILDLIVATVGAAQKGRMMGGSNIWGVVRMAFAMAAITPVQNGLCALQILLLSS